jgi:serine/threonine-protein kinase
MLAEGGKIDQYRVIRKLGEGGMGEVYLAEDTVLYRHVAIKTLRPEFSGRKALVARFFNEARAVTQIADPGIVQVFAFAQTDSSAYIVMELLEGEGMDRRLKRVRRFNPSDALRLIRFVCLSLGAAHAKGIVHRDLKPGNIFIVRDAAVVGEERTKVLDFGVAKLLGDELGSQLTRAGVVLGTPAYMSPEQCRSAGTVDPRSDIYSVGCVLMKLLTGAPPFERKGEDCDAIEQHIINAHLHEPPPYAGARVPGLPMAIDPILQRCLAKSPDERFQTMAELAEAIGSAANISHSVPSITSRDLAAPTFVEAVPPIPSTTAHLTTSVSGANGETPAPPKARRPLIAAGAVASAVAAAAVVTVLMRAPASSTPGANAVVTTADANNPPDSAPAGRELMDRGSAVVSEQRSPVAPPPDAAPLPDKKELARDRIGKVLSAFVDWGKNHRNAPCPSAEDLATATGDAELAKDPWDHPFHLTCTAQPQSQIVGVTSDGPDGVFKTEDDILSWELDDEVTRIVARKSRRRGSNDATDSNDTKVRKNTKCSKDQYGMPICWKP